MPSRQSEAYATWEANIMDAVESSEHAPPLNYFLRHHWGIDKAKVHSVPEWQHGAKFNFDSTIDVLADIQGAALHEARSATKPPPTDGVEGNATTPTRRADGYNGFRLATICDIVEHFPKSINLDRELYPILKQCITGPWAEIIEHVKRPSYILAMATLHEHHNMSRLAQKTEAMDKLDSLQDLLERPLPPAGRSAGPGSPG